MNYRLAYSIGFHPWEDAACDQPFSEKISEMFGREENAREPPHGSALDVGTGSGIWGIELAKRGWQVTGIDIIEKALRRGRERAHDAGVDIRFVHGDVTTLEQTDIGGPFRLVLDTGTFHDFDERQRKAMGRGVSAVASSDATVLLLVWPKRRRPLIRGASRNEVAAAFPDWEITHVEPSHFRLPKPLDLLLRPDEHWYRLRRITHTPASPSCGGDARQRLGSAVGRRSDREGRGRGAVRGIGEP
ncbi:MAG: class I SAM-dependent methyltransferase [Polyangiales bacterium]